MNTEENTAQTAENEKNGSSFGTVMVALAVLVAAAAAVYHFDIMGAQAIAAPYVQPVLDSVMGSKS